MSSDVQHESNADAVKHHLKGLKKASDSDGWMGVLWMIKDGELVLEDKTTWKFPIDDFDNAARQLRNVLDEEREKSVMPEVGKDLPIADFLKEVEEDQAKRSEAILLDPNKLQRREVSADGESVKELDTKQTQGPTIGLSVNEEESKETEVSVDGESVQVGKDILTHGISNMSDDQSLGIGSIGLGHSPTVTDNQSEAEEGPKP